MRDALKVCWVAGLAALFADSAVARTPQWLKDAAAVAVPAQPAWVDAVQLYSQVDVTVAPDGAIRRHVLAAFRILRSAGEGRAVLRVSYGSTDRIKDMQAWTIPAAGKDFEVHLRDAADIALADVDGSELVSDTRQKVLIAPGAHQGAVVGFEFDMDLGSLEQADTYDFQDTIPVLAARYTLVLPPGWVATSAWVNHPPVEATHSDARTWTWDLKNLPAVTIEPNMPVWRAVAGQLYVTFAPPGKEAQLASWQGISSWYAGLERDRLQASEAIRAKVADLTRGAPGVIERLRALAAYVQSDVRYVAIELGIGSYQPHAAADVFANHFGDCKDKATLLAVMLAEAGIQSVPVIINTDRSAVGPDTPPDLGLFNHMILAVRIPAEARTPDLHSVLDAPDGGAFLFFDPTDEVTAVGRLAGGLQGSYGLLAQESGGRLVQLPRTSHADSGVLRQAQMTLDAQGALHGSVLERATGDEASVQRYLVRTSTRDTDVIKPVQNKLAGSLAAFRIEEASITNRRVLSAPFEWHYKLVADAYARRAGDLLIVRPRVLGTQAQDLDDESTSRVHDLTFSEARTDQDEFTIELPAGYAVDALPDPVDIDVGFAAYHSRTEVSGSKLQYRRTYELRELRVPAAKMSDYRRLHQAIARDERAVAVLKSAAQK
jgi:transglutaminase-like putative cysteine protease